MHSSVLCLTLVNMWTSLKLVSRLLKEEDPPFDKIHCNLLISASGAYYFLVIHVCVFSYPMCCGWLSKLNYNIGDNSLQNDSLGRENQHETVTCIWVLGRASGTALLSQLIFLIWAKNLDSELVWGQAHHCQGQPQLWSKATFLCLISAWKMNNWVCRIHQGRSSGRIWWCWSFQGQVLLR